MDPPPTPITTADNGEFFVVTCPHCGLQVQVLRNEVCCTIFRHAALKDTLAQINPHTSKEECDRLTAAGAIVGCGKPFKMDMMRMLTHACGYI